MLSYCHLDPKEHISVKLHLNFKSFHSRKCTRKCRLSNGGHFAQPQCLNSSATEAKIFGANETIPWRPISRICVSPGLISRHAADCEKLRYAQPNVLELMLGLFVCNREAPINTKHVNLMCVITCKETLFIKMHTLEGECSCPGREAVLCMFHFVLQPIMNFGICVHMAPLSRCDKVM